MSSDPTQPMRPPAQRQAQPSVQPTVQQPAFQPPEPAQPTVQQPAFQIPEPAQPTVQQPAYQSPEPAQPTVQQPTFTPKQPAEPTVQQPAYPPQQPPYEDPAYGGLGGPGGPGRRGVRRPRRRRRVRRSVMAIFAVIVLAAVLLIGDRVANAVAENSMASQFTANGFPVKPSVTIEGFPFLTQLAAKDFKKVDISASSIPAGPVTIDSMKATITGMRISGYSSGASATVGHITATAFISFGALAGAGGLGDGSGLTIVPAGKDKLKITASIAGIAADSEEARITQTGPQTISVKVLDSGSILSSVLSSFGSFSFSLPKGVPASLRITGLTLNASGLTVTAAASNATFSQSGK